MVASVTVVVALVATPMPLTALDALGKLSPKAFQAMAEGDVVSVLIDTASRDYAPLVSAVESLGGSVGYQYNLIDAMSARVPASALQTIASNPLVVKVYLDETRHLSAGSDLVRPQAGADIIEPDALLDGVPVPVLADFETLTLSPAQIEELDFAPEVYNLLLTNALGTASAWGRTGFGAGTTVAIIDTGIWGSHFMLEGSVVGGIDLSPDVGTEFQGFNRPDNHWHGSHVAGIVLGHGAIGAKPGNILVKSIEQHTGVTLPTVTVPGAGKLKVIPLFGMAPAAETYVIKVFPHTGAGVSESVIIAAIEHAVEVREERGLDAISMSLGGPTLFDGRDLEDQVVDAAVDAGLVVVSAAGNDGPSPMTVASPGSAHKGVAVAAAVMPVNVRVFWDLFHGNLKAGNDLFVSDDPQVISFSSRGPTADDRGKPDVAAPGVFILSAFPSEASPNGLAFASGTSMATPHTSGAALLVKAFADLEGLTPTSTDIKLALKASGEPLPLYDETAFGAGLINANGALDALAAAELGATQEDLAIESVPLADITTGDFSGSVSLLPGENKEVVFATDLLTSSIRLEITDVDLGKDAPRGQLWLRNFGWAQTGQPQVNSLEVYIHGAKRASSFFDYEIDSANVWGDATFVVSDDGTTAEGALRLDVPIKPFGIFNARLIEPGFYKIVIENDYTSFDEVSFSYTVNVDAAALPTPDAVFSGTVLEDDVAVGFLAMPEGVTQVTFQMTWPNDWSQYPTDDLDLVLFRLNEASGTFEFVDAQAATLNAPELSVIQSPESGLYALLVIGFSIPVTGESTFTVEIFLEMDE